MQVSAQYVDLVNLHLTVMADDGLDGQLIRELYFTSFATALTPSAQSCYGNTKHHAARSTTNCTILHRSRRSCYYGAISRGLYFRLDLRDSPLWWSETIGEAFGRWYAGIVPIFAPQHTKGTS